MWSPQHYISEGRRRGVSEATLANSVEQIEAVTAGPYRLPSILTLNHLAVRSGVSYVALKAVVERAEEFYRYFPIRKRSGGKRLISVPRPDLLLVQRWLAANVLRNIPVHPAAYAFIPSRSITDCAARHSGARWLIKLDIIDFFGSITEIQAYRVFARLGYEALVAFELARICTHLPPMSRKYKSDAWKVRWPRETIAAYQQDFVGRLPQGAPTSPMLSNLAMGDLDDSIVRLATDRGLTYTRYSDDLTFSTRRDQFGRKAALEFVAAVSRILKRKGLVPHPRKTTIVPPGARKIVLGLLVDGPAPRLPIGFRSAMRQHLHYLKRFGPFEHAKSRDFESIGGMYRYLRGLIDFANMVEPEYAKGLMKQFEEVQWPTSSM